MYALSRHQAIYSARQEQGSTQGVTTHQQATAQTGRNRRARKASARNSGGCCAAEWHNKTAVCSCSGGLYLQQGSLAPATRSWSPAYPLVALGFGSRAAAARASPFALFASAIARAVSATSSASSSASSSADCRARMRVSARCEAAERHAPSAQTRSTARPAVQGRHMG